MIADAVAGGMARRMRVDAVEVGGAPASLDDDVTLLVVGGPTHATKVSKPHLPGSAARAAEKRLRRLGFRVAVPAESFHVEGTLGLLLEGEQDRAMRWSDQLGATTRELARGVRP